MSSIKKFTSSKRLLITNISLAAAIVLLTIVFSNIYLHNKQEQVQLERNTLFWANSLAQSSTLFVKNNAANGRDELKKLLRQIITPSFINYVHIYQKDENEDIQFYTGFNKSIYFPTIPNKIDAINKLSTIHYEKNYIEVIIPIKQDQELLGYLYIQSSLKEIQDYMRELYIVAMLYLVFGLVIALLLALSIHKKITHPIKIMVETIKTITKSKNYNQPLEKMPLIEFDILAQNINILLSRIKKQITKLDDLHQEDITHKNKLTDKVQARTNALKESNQELLSTLEKLHQFQDQLVENEKMASLGDMVAGIAHEINTPIGLGVTASSLLSDRLNEIKQAFDDKTLKSSQLSKFLVQGQENLGIIYRNMERAAKLITSFKKVAVDQSNNESRQFNVKELIEEVVLTLKAKLSEAHVKVNVNCPDTLIVDSKPGPINQILINLIINSIIHGFEGRSHGHIYISITYLSQQIHLNYLDDGIGIDSKVKNKIFEPFTTTKRGSGCSGLGLHLVYNLVTQALKGNIEYDASINDGTSFNITLPVQLISE